MRRSNNAIGSISFCGENQMETTACIIVRRLTCDLAWRSFLMQLAFCCSGLQVSGLLVWVLADNMPIFLLQILTLNFSKEGRRKTEEVCFDHGAWAIMIVSSVALKTS